MELENFEIRKPIVKSDHWTQIFNTIEKVWEPIITRELVYDFRKPLKHCESIKENILVALKSNDPVMGICELVRGLREI